MAEHGVDDTYGHYSAVMENRGKEGLVATIKKDKDVVQELIKVGKIGKIPVTNLAEVPQGELDNFVLSLKKTELSPKGKPLRRYTTGFNPERTQHIQDLVNKELAKQTPTQAAQTSVAKSESKPTPATKIPSPKGGKVIAEGSYFPAATRTGQIRPGESVQFVRTYPSPYAEGVGEDGLFYMVKTQYGEVPLKKSEFKSLTGK